MTVGQLVPFLFIGAVFTIWFVKQLDELAREQENNVSFIYGIAWTRDELPDPIEPEDVEWFDTPSEATREFHARDDKYWPSALVKAQIGEVVVVQPGEAPEALR